MPDGARVLSVGNQGLTPVLWAEVDPDAEGVRRWFYTYGTGNVQIDEDHVYIGTYQLPIIER